MTFRPRGPKTSAQLTSKSRKATTAFLGLELDPDRNGQVEGERLISTADSAGEIWVIPTNEERIIAQDTHRIAGQKESG